MLPISLARRVTAPRCLCSASPFNANARRSRAFLRPSYQCPCFSMHLLFCAALSCAFARPLAANPTQCRAHPSNSNAFLRSAAASRCRSFPLQFLALPSLSIAEHSLAAADRSCSAAYRSFALASQCSSELFHCASARCTSMQFLGHSRHCHANATLSLLSKSIAPQSSPLLFHRSARQSSAAAVVRHAAAYAP